VLSSRSLKIAALGLAVLVAGCDRESGPTAQPATAEGSAVPAGALDRSHKGSEMPELVFTDPAGKQLRLSSLKGQPLLINLWATWCAPCVAELPMLDALAARQAGKLKVLTVSQDGPKSDKVAGFLAARGVKLLEPWLDPELAMMDHYQAGTLPLSILYDANGREVWRFTGPREWGDAESAKLLGEAL
jgi:thiol-disulfide isomerase/thioredoxin